MAETEEQIDSTQDLTFTKMGKNIVNLDLTKTAIAVIIGRKLNQVTSYLKNNKQKKLVVIKDGRRIRNLQDWLDIYTNGNISKTTAYDYIKISNNINLLKKKFGNDLKVGIVKSLEYLKKNLDDTIKEAKDDLAAYDDKALMKQLEKTAKDKAMASEQSKVKREEKKDEKNKNLNEGFELVVDGIEATLGLIAANDGSPTAQQHLKNSIESIICGMEKIALENKRDFQAAEPTNTKLKSLLKKNEKFAKSEKNENEEEKDNGNVNEIQQLSVKQMKSKLNELLKIENVKFGKSGKKEKKIVATIPQSFKDEIALADFISGIVEAAFINTNFEYDYVELVSSTPNETEFNLFFENKEE